MYCLLVLINVYLFFCPLVDFIVSNKNVIRGENRAQRQTELNIIQKPSLFKTSCRKPNKLQLYMVRRPGNKYPLKLFMVAIERFRNSSACRGRRPKCGRNCSRRPCWTLSRRACWTRSRRTFWTSEFGQRINSNVIVEAVLLINGCVIPPFNARMDPMSTTVPVESILSSVPTDSVLVSTCHAMESTIAGIIQMRRFVSALLKCSNIRMGNVLLSTSSAMGSMTTEIDQTKISVVCSNWGNLSWWRRIKRTSRWIRWLPCLLLWWMEMYQWPMH